MIAKVFVNIERVDFLGVEARQIHAYNQQYIDTILILKTFLIGGCRAIVSSAHGVSSLCESYAESDLKHIPQQTDNYIDNPKESGYRGVHLIYRYHSDRRQDYNSLKIEMQLRSQFQHAWATAVETVGAFVKQALKSSLGEQEWLRFFALMGGALAFKENTAPVPGTPNAYPDLVKEIKEYARSLEVSTRLRAFAASLQYYEGAQSKKDHYYLIELNNAQRTRERHRL
ncbi:RelA/SpoT domain-containing protein [Bradyrhizobium japonicum]|nr:RelA/SpoT domain-containing protein [Bradyrhizobium japonicum]